MIVGLTGGIGSGKTTVLNEFKALNIPVYIADVEAKKLMHTSNTIKTKLIDLLGDEAYVDNELNRGYVASKVFKNKVLLDRLNEIVHPEVRQHFKEYVKQNSNPYLIYESAILFEKGLETTCDRVIVVTANLEERIERVVKRDKITRKAVLERMNNQWTQEEKVALADYVIENHEKSSLKTQVNSIHLNLIQEKL